MPRKPKSPAAFSPQPPVPAVAPITADVRRLAVEAAHRLGMDAALDTVDWVAWLTRDHAQALAAYVQDCEARHRKRIGGRPRSPNPTAEALRKRKARGVE